MMKYVSPWFDHVVNVMEMFLVVGLQDYLFVYHGGWCASQQTVWLELFLHIFGWIFDNKLRTGR